MSQEDRRERLAEVFGHGDCGYQEASGETPVATALDGGHVARFWVVNSTDGGDDGWIDTFDSEAEMLAKVESFAEDEWGLGEVFDLERNDYTTALPVEVKARIV